MSRPTYDPKLSRWWWRTLREWIYVLIDPLWAAFRGDNTDDIALVNVTGVNGVTSAELAVLDGITATTAELDKLAGLTANAVELNRADRTKSDVVAEASRNVVLDANKDLFGKRYDITRSLLETISNGPGFRFRGSDTITIPGGDQTRFPDNDFSIVARIKANTNVAGAGIISMLDGNDDGWRLIYYSDDNLWASINSVDMKTTSGNVSNGERRVVGVTFDRSGNGQIYVDGVPDGPPVDITGQTLDIATSTVMVGASAEMDIGCIYLFNRALSTEDWKGLASGMPLDFADVGASQADLITNGEDWTGASGSTPPNSWSDTGSGSATYIIRDNTPVENFGDNKALEFNASDGSKTLYQGVAQAGKRYRVSFVYRNLEGSSSSYVALGSSANKVTLQNTGITGDGIVFEQELLSEGTDLMFFVGSGGTLQIDHVQVIQVGCVAAYLPDGITHAQWQDAGGNELHGAVNGAVPMNLPSNHVGRYIKPGITGDTTLTNVIPAGYRIKSMVAEVSGASSGMILNVGTTAGGSDVVNGQDISANGLFDLTVAKSIFSLSAAQNLYVNDDGGTAWSGVSVDLYIEMERVK
ncbi:MAG: hypothetical protein ACETWG_10585 [Candidatus Neomarinimicrobiota bacterium]